MNRTIVQKYILLGALVVLLGGIVLLTSAPTQETGQSVTQETIELSLPNRPPEGYQVPARPVVTFPYTNISADRLRLANMRRVSDYDESISIQPVSFPAMSPDGQWKLSYPSDGGFTDGITITQSDGSGEARVLLEEEQGSDRKIVHDYGYANTSPVWSWDGKRVFYEVERSYYVDVTESYQRRQRERWIESIDIATGEVIQHTVDTDFRGNVHSFATARHPRDPVVYLDYDDEIVSVGTYDGSARWVIDHDVNFGLSSFPPLSPDKKMIVVYRGRNNLIYATDGSGLLYDLDDIPTDGHDFLWSLDNTKLVYQSSDYDGHTGEVLASELYLIDVDGASRTQLTDTPDVHEGVAGWTPDGQLVFVDYSDGSRYIADLVAK